MTPEEYSRRYAAQLAFSAAFVPESADFFVLESELSDPPDELSAGLPDDSLSLFLLELFLAALLSALLSVT